MPQWAGMPEDDANYRIEPCGCHLVRVALPGDPWVYRRRCAMHEQIAEEEEAAS